MVALGGVVGVGLGKFLFGGLGYNAFNPALVGRAFLQAAFPVAMTTWYPALGGRTASRRCRRRP
jgi:electron transport complex protein RnfD